MSYFYLAYAWANEACLLDHGRLIRKYSAEEFPQQVGMLEQYGLGVPQAARLYLLLVARGLLRPPGERAPRSCAELAHLLEVIPIND